MMYSINRQRAIVLHYLRDKALEQVQTESKAYRLMLRDENPTSFDQNNCDMSLLNANAVVDGLSVLAKKMVFYPITGEVKVRWLQRQLEWFARELALYTAKAHDKLAELGQEADDEMISDYCWLEEARKFVFDLAYKPVEPTPPASTNDPEDKVPSWDELDSASQKPGLFV